MKYLWYFSVVNHILLWLTMYRYVWPWLYLVSHGWLWLTMFGYDWPGSTMAYDGWIWLIMLTIDNHGYLYLTMVYHGWWWLIILEIQLTILTLFKRGQPCFVHSWLWLNMVNFYWIWWSWFNMVKNAWPCSTMF